MIVNVGLSPSSLIDISIARVGTPPHALAIQRAVAECLRSHGSLIFSSNEEADAVLQLTKPGSDLTEPERQAWTNLFGWLTKGERVRVSRPPFTSLETLQSADQAAQIPHRPFIGVVPDAVFNRLYPGTRDGWVSTTASIDIAVSAAVSASDQFKFMQTVAAREVYPPGTDREVVWEELLRPLATRTKRITLFDRFTFAELYRRDAKQDAANEHLVWLLQKLNTEGRPGTLVKIYGSTGYASGQTSIPSNPASIAQLLKQRWSPVPGRLAGVELVTLKGLSSFPHDRHATFGDTTGLELPSGLDRLASGVISSPFSFGYKWINAQLQALRDRVAKVDHQLPQVTAVYVTP